MLERPHVTGMTLPWGFPTPMKSPSPMARDSTVRPGGLGNLRPAVSLISPTGRWSVVHGHRCFLLAPFARFLSMLHVSQLSPLGPIGFWYIQTAFLLPSRARDLSSSSSSSSSIGPFILLCSLAPLLGLQAGHTEGFGALTAQILCCATSRTGGQRRCGFTRPRTSPLSVGSTQATPTQTTGLGKSNTSTIGADMFYSMYLSSKATRPVLPVLHKPRALGGPQIESSDSPMQNYPLLTRSLFPPLRSV